MNGAFYIGATGLDAQQRALEVVSNNITNMNTPAFKRSEVRFSELVGRAPGANEGGAAVAPASTLGVSADAAPRVFVQGDLRETGNPLDLAISGDGFVELMGPGGQTLLWRGGTLRVTDDGYLAAANGLPLKAMVSIPIDATAVSIGRDGEVRALTPGAAEAESIGRIEIVRAKDLSALTPVEGGLYAAASETDLISADGEQSASALVQGSLEQSNVELTQEMVSLMMMQRAYAASAQLVQAGDQLMAIANNLRK